MNKKSHLIPLVHVIFNMMKTELKVIMEEGDSRSLWLFLIRWLDIVNCDWWLTGKEKV